MQNLHYTYDPAGNITHIRDDAQQTVHFRNRRVEPGNDYVYDALYRLIQADGREHLGQAAGGGQLPPTAADGFNAFHARLAHPGDGNAMGAYTERYVYDAVGNFLEMQHRGSDPAHPGWTRAYAYAEASLTEAGKQSNRLSRTQLGAGGNSNPEPYQHDAHGNMIRMPHLGGSHSSVSGPFAVDDLVDAPSLAARLKQPKRQVELWLVAQLSSDTNVGLATYPGTGPVPTALQNDLLHDLNRLLSSAPSIYERYRFAGVALSSETHALLQADPNGARLMRLNRLLIEDAFPRELSVSGTVPNMHWDYKDQLCQTDLGGGGAAFYVYDASGQRVRKVWMKAPGLTEERIYLGGTEIFRRHGGPIGTNTATLERETLHVMDDRQRIALVETRMLDAPGTDRAPRQLIRYQFGNHLGSASLELDEQAQIISYEEYAPYGSSTYQAVRSQTETAKRYRYSGKERDEESGLCYHGARYCAAWVGRWMSSDPAGLLDSNNMYLFVRSNPVKLTDRTGLIGETPIGPVLPEAAVVPQKGDWGSVLPYSKQPRALYDAAGVRLTENEHIIPKGNLEAVTTDPATGIADYTKRDYRKDATVRVERDFALEKTAGNPAADNPRTARLKADVTQGGSVNYRDVFTDAIDNAKDRVGSAVSDEAINRGALGQDGNLFGLQRLEESAKKVSDAGGVIEDFDIVEYAAPAVEKTSKVSKVLKVTGQVVEVGGGVLGAATGGWQVGTGIDQLAQGKTGEGAVNVAEGGVNLGMTIGVPILVKSGAIVAGGGAVAVTAATLVATASVGLAAETARAAFKGEETPIDVADKFYGTHFGDMYGWVTGAYSKQ